MYEYLVGTLIFGLFWLIGFTARKDLRKAILWNGLAYIVINLICRAEWKILSLLMYIGEPIIPSYWNPHTLFNLGRITGLIAVEDMIFEFFVAGLAGVNYNIVFNKQIKYNQCYKPHSKALIVALVVSGMSIVVFKCNAIYAIIMFGFAGAASIWLDRNDLIKHSLLGGLLFVAIYIFGLLIFDALFPYFFEAFYNYQNITGILLIGIPLEEYAYAFSFGLMWAPIYEYQHGEITEKI
jgi:hypothetical protein